MVPPPAWQDERIEMALGMVEQASQLSRRLQDRIGDEFYSKLDSSPVTLADLSVQALVGFTLKKYFPQDSFIAEETAESLLGDESLVSLIADEVSPFIGTISPEEILDTFRSGESSEDTWILDPIDGTKGFLRGDQFAIALAFAENNDIKFGLVGCPRLSLKGAGQGSGIIGLAAQGKGAWQSLDSHRNWERIKVSAQTEVAQFRLLRSFEASHTNEQVIEDLVEGLGIVAPPFRVDSQAKCLLLARGDSEVIIRCLSPSQPHYKEKIWDQAAGAILVAEAGGKVSDLHGRALDFSCGNTLAKNVGVLSSNGVLHETLVDALGN